MTAENGSNMVSEVDNISSDSVRRVIDVAENSCGYIHNLPEGMGAHVDKVDGVRVLHITTTADENDGPFYNKYATSISDEEGWVHSPSACSGIKRWSIAINQNGKVIVSASVFPDAPFGDLAAIAIDVKSEDLNAAIEQVLVGVRALEDKPLTTVDKLRIRVRGVLGL